MNKKISKVSTLHVVDVYGNSDNLVEKCMSGMLRNMADEYHVEDSKDDK